MAFYSSSKAAKARADRPEEFHRLAGLAVKPCCWFGPAKHALPTDRANGYYARAVKRETPWTYHAKGKRGVRSKSDAEIAEIGSGIQRRIPPNPLAFRELENLSGPRRVIDVRNPRISLFR
ncbi:Uncharacterized protein DBV15_06843 [Temnothorax longispinosus]|uniref:Uncharacterized protein n=1 Tax=Temnothorax longispinosus TaxID=300112 RepID=A0A4S2JCV5_9HYME|nr:Uncharacterized protein DBV15_06843 [Temnothorax longispinosus]